MTKEDRKKLGVLIVLLAALGVTTFLSLRTTPAESANVVSGPKARPSANPPAPSDARIRLDLVENPDVGEGIGKRNLFQYRQAPEPAPFQFPRGSASLNARPAQPDPLPAARFTPPPAPPAPSIPLKYQGFAVINAPNRGLTAFLADDSRHYNVTTGEILMGRYRIANITDKNVEVEDLQNKWRQTLPLLK